MNQTDNTPELVTRLLSQAQRYETPCGDGSLVWHHWGTGQPIVLGHGAGGSWLHWIRNIEALAEHYSVWAVDMPGMGDSALPPENTHTAIAEALLRGMKELLEGQPVTLAGFSFGGVCFAYFAHFHPELVRRLILVGTGGLETPRGDIHIQGMKGLSAEQRVAANRSNLLQMMLAHESSVDELTLYIHSHCGRRNRLNPAPFVLPDKLQQVLPEINVPIDVIWGELDRPHPIPEDQEEVFKRFQPNMDFRVMKGSGHWAMYEGGEAFNTALLELLAAPVREHL